VKTSSQGVLNAKWWPVICEVDDEDSSETCRKC
jgi:hypothetical protein